MNRQQRRAAEKRTKNFEKKALSSQASLSPEDQAVLVQGKLQQALQDHKAGLLMSAIEGYQDVIKLRPDIAAAHNALGAALNSQGRHDEALEAFNSALKVDPSCTAAPQNKNNLLSILANDGEYTPASNTPDETWSVSQLFNHANHLKKHGQLKEASKVFTHVIRKDPKHARAYANLGDTMIDMRMYDSATAMLQASLLYEPGNAATYNALGTALAYQGQIDDSLDAFKHSLSINPSNVATLTNLGNTYKDLGDIEKAIQIYRQALDITPRVDVHSNILLAMHYVPTYSQEDIYNEHRTWNELYAKPLAPKAKTFSNNSDPDRTLKIGLVSGSFRRHPVGYMTISALESLSRENLHLSFYTNTGNADDLTARFSDRADHWEVVAGLSDEALAQKIQNDDIDILIDLAGHSEGTRLLTFAQKPAPIQAKWVGGQINTTGMDVMDYFISDSVETPEGVDAFYTENIVRLPDGYVCYDPPKYAPDVGPLPALSNGYMTFGCFNNLTKVTPEVVRHWSQLLSGIKNSRLVLKSKALNDATVCQRYLGLFEQHGIDPSRIELRESSPHNELLGQYNDIDIALDPFPYSGGLTTVEALYMGVPVITMPGETFAARHAASHISNVGLQDWICDDQEQYLALATSWSEKTDELSGLRKALREQVKASPLCDAPRFAGHFEEALRNMWRTWCAEQT